MYSTYMYYVYVVRCICICTNLGQDEERLSDGHYNRDSGHLEKEQQPTADVQSSQAGSGRKQVADSSFVGFHILHCFLEKIQII